VQNPNECRFVVSADVAVTGCKNTEWNSPDRPSSVKTFIMGQTLPPAMWKEVNPVSDVMENAGKDQVKIRSF